MNKSIPFLDLKSPYHELKDELDAAYHRVMKSGWYILGEEVEAFEHEFAEYCNVKYCIGVGNGLEALHLALRGLGIKEGDEVIVPSNTYIATWLAVSYTGARPIPVEPDIKTYNIDPNRVEAAITSKTRAIIPVHLYGQPADMEAILSVAERHGLLVIEDAAQSQGAKYKGKQAGSFGNAAGVSFYPGKNLGAYGDAGVVLTPDDKLAEKVRMLRNYGSKIKYYNEMPGYNSRLDTLQAAFLRVKLRHLDNWNERRKKIAEFYLDVLKGLDGLVLPHKPNWADAVWHIFAIRILGGNRDNVQQYLNKNGIGTLIHYPIPPHLSQAYKDLELHKGVFPIAEEIAESILSIPIGPHLNLDYCRRDCKRYQKLLGKEHMSTSHLVSVIITSWNSGAYLPRCLDSLAAQTFRDFEVIIVDNGSTEGALKNPEKNWPGLNFQILALKENKGYTVANNLGAKLARGKWLALLNTDAFPATDWLENLLKAAGQRPEYSVFASRQLQAGAPQLLDGSGDAYHVSGQAWRRFYNYPADKYGLEEEEVFSSCGAAAFYSRSAFEEIGGFDEDFFSYLEDVDIGFRLRLRGNRCLYVPQASVYHIGSASLGLRSDFAFYHGHRNIIWSFVQNMPSRLLWQYLPAHLMVNFIYLGVYSLRGKGRVLWQAKIDALKGMQRALQKRKFIQKSVIVSECDLVNSMERNWLDPYLIGYRARAVTRENGQEK